MLYLAAALLVYVEWMIRRRRKLIDEEVDFIDWCNTNRVDSNIYAPTKQCDIL